MRSDDEARWRRQTHRLQMSQVIATIVLLGLAIFLLYSQGQHFAGDALNRAKANHQLITKIQAVEKAAHADLVDHRLAARCHERQDTLDLDYIMRLISHSQHKPLPPAIEKAIKDIPPANVSGVDCRAELRDNLPHSIRRNTP